MGAKIATVWQAATLAKMTGSTWTILVRKAFIRKLDHGSLRRQLAIFQRVRLDAGQIERIGQGVAGRPYTKD